MSWLPKQNVVVPIDFSEPSMEALDTALELVDEPGRLHAVSVLPPISAMEPGVIWGTIDDNTRRLHAEEALKEKLSADKYRGVQTEILMGNPGHEIVEYARLKQADLIVISSHGRSGMSHLIIGSVAERVVRHSPCPILVLRTKN